MIFSTLYLVVNIARANTSITKVLLSHTVQVE